MDHIVPRRNRLLRSPPKSRESGFILILVLVAISVMAAGAAYFAGRVDTMRQRATVLARTADAERVGFTAREALAHAFLTNNAKRPGWFYADSMMRFDGRAYRIGDSHTIRVQDERGLISLNTYDRQQLDLFLTNLGEPIERRSQLLDLLADYADADDLRRIGGAELNEYRELELPPPANDFVRHRDELRRVIGWRDLLARVESRYGGQAAERFLALFSASRVPALNLNTAPRAVLASVPGINPARVAAMIDQRNVKPFASLAEVLPFASGGLDPERHLLVPAPGWRVSVGSANLPFLLECRVRLDPFSRERPVTVSECQRRSSGSVDSAWDQRLSSSLAERADADLNADIRGPSIRQTVVSPAVSTQVSQMPGRGPTTAQPIQQNANDNSRPVDAENLEWLSRHVVDAEAALRSPARR